MKILLFSSYYAPEVAGNAPYVTGVAEGLAATGADVTVVAGYPHYPSWRPEGRRLRTREVLNGVTVRRYWHYVPARQSAIRRALYEATLAAGSAAALSCRDADVVLGVVPSLASGVSAAAAGRIHKKPVGLIFQDVMGRGAAQSGVSGGGRVAALVNRAEVATAQRATGIAVVADAFADHFVKHGVPRQRIARVRNWSRWEPERVELEGPRSQSSHRVATVVLHAGNMGHKQDLENVLRAAQVLRDDPSFRFVLAGSGNQRAALEQLAARLALPNVTFLPPQPSGVFEELLLSADILLVNQRPEVGDMSLPSKLTSYFAAGRPVIAAVDADSEAAREIRRSGGGVLVPPSDPAALATAVRSVAADAPRAAALGASGRRYADDELTFERAFAGYLEFIADVADGRAARGGAMVAA